VELEFLKAIISDPTVQEAILKGWQLGKVAEPQCDGCDQRDRCSKVGWYVVDAESYLAALEGNGDHLQVN